MELRKLVNYLWMLFLVSLLVLFCIIAINGDKIHDKVCPSVKAVKIKNVMFEGVRYCCINRDCVLNGRVYEIYNQKGFFNENTRVRSIEVETEDLFPDTNLLVIKSGIGSYSQTYFAVLSDQNLEDGEAVVVSNK